jgi:hypothetical protein
LRPPSIAELPMLTFPSPESIFAITRLQPCLRTSRMDLFSTPLQAFGEGQFAWKCMHVLSGSPTSHLGQSGPLLKPLSKRVHELPKQAAASTDSSSDF